MSGWSHVALRAAVVVSSALALGAPGVALGQDIHTPEGHHAEDQVVHDAATEARLNRETKQRSEAPSRAAAAAVATDPGQVGRWGPTVDWPVVGIHVALLPNGKVLAWDSVGDRATETFPVHDFTRATVYDPATGTHTQANVDTGHNVFCAGFAHLPDGRLFLAGGNKDAQLNGIEQTHVFNPANNTWSVGANMAAGRWYPSVTPLTNGEMLITEGGPDVPEVRKTDGTLRTLSSASLNLPLYPWLDVAPDGQVFHSGPDQTLRKLDPAGTGSWQSVGQRDGIHRDYGSHAVFDVGKTLVAGGGSSSSDARVIDTNGATPQVAATSPMAFGRRQHNLTLLADGSILATGGNSTGASLVDMNGGVYNAERWNPATGQWTTLAAQAVTRQYHSTALLLPDGRVLSSGGGICWTCDQVGYLAKNAEIFTPPYLFKNDGSGQLAPRPEITGAPGTVSHGTSFQITTPNAASIRKVGLIRLGSQTHSVEMEQRYLPLGFTAGSGTLTANVPANAHTAVPGVYMLFIVDSAGVPSVAKMVTIESAAAPPPPPPPSDWTFCANEHERCNFTGTQEVRYGANGTFTAPRTFTDGVDCSNAVFGDPLPGVVKHCERRAPSSSPPPPPPPPSNQPPTVSLTSPANGASFTAPAKIPLAATAADADGTVVRVEFFNGATKLAEDATAPYTGQWSTGAAGTYTLTARATDNAGATTTSDPVTITVKKKKP
jgi:Domain of unknown function (DUF1929)/Bacterial Ig domain